MGWFNDIVNGTEKKYKADPLAGDINTAAKTGIGYVTGGANKLNDLYNQDPNEVVNSQISLENKMARTAADDATRRTRALIASRGMQNSSIGLGQQINQDRQLNNQVAMNNASGIAHLRDMSIQNAQGQMQAGQGLFNLKQAQGPIQLQDQYARTGGYGQLIGAGLQAGAMAYGKGK